MVLSLQNEVWKQVNDCYSVSNLGRVKSHARQVKAGRGTRIIKEAILSTFIKKITGYPSVSIFKKQISVHKLVVLAFIGEKPFKNAQVNHKDGDRTNNIVSNLEWVTPAENVKHGFLSNGRTSVWKNKFGKMHFASKPVMATNLQDGSVLEFDSAMDAVRIGFKSDGISRVCNGKQKSHAGYVWKYLENQPDEPEDLSMWCAPNQTPRQAIRQAVYEVDA